MESSDVKWEKSSSKRRSKGRPSDVLDTRKHAVNAQVQFEDEALSAGTTMIKSQTASATANALRVSDSKGKENQPRNRSSPSADSPRQASAPKKKHRRTASLTELRPEDKKKVANLIQELAALGSEKEKVENLLKKERNNFEKAIMELVSDQKRLLTERQCVQSELVACQRMLNQLQEVVLNKPSSSMTESVTKGTGTRTTSVTSHSQKPKAHSDFDGNLTLDDYLSKQSSVYESAEVASVIYSVSSEPPHRPEACSTGWLNPVLGDGTGRDRLGMPLEEAASINYSSKDQLSDERTRLIEEHKILTRKLLQQEELLRQTQRKLHQTQREKDVLSASARLYKETDGLGQGRPAAGQGDAFSLTQSMKEPRGPEATRIPAPQNAPSVQTPLEQRLHNSTYSVGIQVCNPDLSGRSAVVTTTKDISVQAELPAGRATVALPTEQIGAAAGTPDTSESFYVGNRLVPSPRQPRSVNSSFEETMARTSKLLASARKIIDESKSSSSVCSRADRVSPSSCRHSYQMVTPQQSARQRASARVTSCDPKDLFGVPDASLAADINSESARHDSDADADRTELELLEDVFYVR